MNTNRIFVLVKDYSFIFRSENSREPRICHFHHIHPMPNTPFHLRLWDDDKHQQLLKNFFVTEVLEQRSIITKWRGVELNVLLEDDTLLIEQKALEEYLMQYLKPKRITVSKICQYVCQSSQGFIAITETSRMYVITSMNQGVVIQQGYLEKKVYEADEFKKQVAEIAKADTNFTWYLNGNSLQRYRAIGQMVTDEELMENFSSLYPRK